ncbi:uncharacterized protein ACRADG_002078 [Cochliomyia hominivorax]
MKLFIIFTIFLLIQTFAAQQLKDDHQPDHINQQHVANQVTKEGHQVQAAITPQTQQNSVQHNSQDQQHNKQNVAQLVAQQNVANPAQHTNQNKVQSSVQSVTSITDNSNSHKVPVQIPAKVQHVVTQVSQHIPAVMEQHDAKQNTKPKERMVRSLVNKFKLMEKPRKCFYDCSPSDPQVCANNGHCYREFESQCEMSAYNCLNTQKKFHLVQDSECQDLSAVKCYPGDV